MSGAWTPSIVFPIPCGPKIIAHQLLIVWFIVFRCDSSYPSVLLLLFLEEFRHIYTTQELNWYFSNRCWLRWLNFYKNDKWQSKSMTLAIWHFLGYETPEHGSGEILIFNWPNDLGRHQSGKPFQASPVTLLWWQMNFFRIGTANNLALLQLWGSSHRKYEIR